MMKKASVGIDDARVPPPTMKTRASVEAMMDEVEEARLFSEWYVNDAVSRTGYHARHVLHRLPYFDPVLDYLNDFMHKIYNITKYIFEYICHYHFNTARRVAFMKENRRFTMNDINHAFEDCVNKKNECTVKWVQTNAWMKKHVTATSFIRSSCTYSAHMLY
jgi:hypothetical protein